jgi:hypothetical protein
LVEYPDTESVAERLIKRLSGEEMAQLRAAPANSPLTRELQKFQADLIDLQSLNDPRGVYARTNVGFKLD